MTHLVYKITGFNKEKVIGMAGVLDSARMRYFIAKEVGCLPREVSAMVLGGHGDLMVPVMSQVRIKNNPISNFSKEKERAIIKRTQEGGAEIVSLLKSGSAYYAPASSVAEMVSSIILDKKNILPCCAYLDGQYGIFGVYSGVPVKLGKNGIDKIVRISLSDDESEALRSSAQKIQNGIKELELLKY
jgi:malate dehydrogenase